MLSAFPGNSGKVMINDPAFDFCLASSNKLIKHWADDYKATFYGTNNRSGTSEGS